MSLPRSLALGVAFKMSHTVIIDPLCAADRYTGDMQTAQIYHDEKKNENSSDWILKPLTYKITSIISIILLFISVLSCLCSHISG